MKKVIFTSDAPSPIGAYNQAIMINGFLYVSGQIAINPKNGLFITDSIELETKQVMENLHAILKASEMQFQNVIKTSIFIKRMPDFSKINKVYASYFDDKNAPARETVEVSGLPKNVNVEISLIAHRD